jgi:hypothetical protein
MNRFDAVSVHEFIHQVYLTIGLEVEVESESVVRCRLPLGSDWTPRWSIRSCFDGVLDETRFRKDFFAWRLKNRDAPIVLILTVDAAYHGGSYTVTFKTIGAKKTADPRFFRENHRRRTLVRCISSQRLY